MKIRYFAVVLPLLASSFCAFRTAVALGVDPHERQEEPRGRSHRGMGLGYIERLGIQLSQKQKDTLGPILQNSRQQIFAIRENPRLTQDQKNNQLTALHARRTAHIRKVLTADQWKLFIERMSAFRR